MTGRLDQARSRHTARARRRMDQLAEHVADGLSVKDSGQRLGLTKGETSRAWSNVRKLVGMEQAR